jgi:glycerol-3-phosphate acyltransferase PlsY
MGWHIALMAALTGYLLGSVSFARILMKVIAPEGGTT